MSAFKNIGKVYALLAILISVFVVAIISGGILNDTTKIFLPEYSLSSKYDDNYSYKKYKYDEINPEWASKKQEALEKLTDTELTEARLKDRALALKTAILDAKADILGSMPYLLVFLIVLLTHVYVYRRFDRVEKQSE